MHVGLVILPTDRWSEARRQWEWADDTGFATGWTYDHIRWGGMPDGPWHSAVPVLSAAAVVTSRLRLGTLVATPNFRHPVTLAAGGDHPRRPQRRTAGPRTRTRKRRARRRDTRANALVTARAVGSIQRVRRLAQHNPQRRALRADVDANRALCGGASAEHSGNATTSPPADDRRRRSDRARGGSTSRTSLGHDRADQHRFAHADQHLRNGSSAGRDPRRALRDDAA